MFGGHKESVMSNNELLSKTISYLRFPLIVGVVFIHNQMEEIDIQGNKVNYDAWPWLTHIMDFFSSVLPTISVPLFFFISGFLFFYKVDFDKAVYKEKLKTRNKTLLVPYLIWNFVGFLLFLVKMHPAFCHFFPLLTIYRVDILTFLNCFWITNIPTEYGFDYAPINYPMWFVRDLLFLVVATPVIHLLIKRMNLLYILVSGFLWFWGLGRYVGFLEQSHQSIFFFPLGAYFSINRFNFVELAHRAKWSPYAYIVLAIGDTLSKGQPYNYWFHNGGILVGMITVVYIASVLVGNEKVKASKFLSDASFFVFAIHGLFISKFMKTIVMTIHPQSPYQVLFIYFLVPITTILICLGLYKLLNRYMPSVAKIITGSR